MFTKEEELLIHTALKAGIVELKLREKHDVVDKVMEVIEQGMGMVENPKEWLENLLSVYELMHKELSDNE